MGHEGVGLDGERVETPYVFDKGDAINDRVAFVVAALSSPIWLITAAPETPAIPATEVAGKNIFV